jgi:glutamate synthase (NADPH/NADH) large chain
MRLVGDANDYVGKGLSGGRIVVHPPEQSPFVPEENVIAGNVILYGATAGELFVRGVVGERFCVRNSGATAVVDAVGDHACEYMTGGRVIVLGMTGRNFGAGMSGGIAYVYDADDTFANRLNDDMVDNDPLEVDDLDFLKATIARHRELTGSTVAAGILDDWHVESRKFAKVMPTDYKRVLEAARIAEEKGLSVDEAIMAAAHG